MCMHEGQECSGPNCPCPCDNCILGEYDEDQAAADNADAGLDDHGDPIDMDCPMCRPFPCDDPDNHLRHQIPSRYTPLANRGCHCGADFDGRDCMCFED